MPLALEAKLHDHLVQFYQDDISLTGTLADYFRAGADAGERLLALLTPTHRDALLQKMKTDGMDTRRLIAEGQLVILDARSVLDQIMHNGMPVYSLFEQHVLTHIKASAPTPVRAFGELVNLLCEDGNPSAAIELEDIWHGVCEHLPVTLFCGYDLYAFHQDGGQQAYRTICSQHSHVFPACDQALDHLTAAASAEQKAMRIAIADVLDRGEMTQHFSPMVCARTRQVLGVYALPYWHSPRYGILASDKWMDAAREAGQSGAIRRWLLHGACQQAMGFYVVPGSGLRMTVPVSGDDITSSDLVVQIDEALSASGLPGEMLELEVPGQALDASPKKSATVLKALKALGVRLSVTDVTSSSSILRYFGHYSVDAIRLGEALIKECVNNRYHQETIESMIGIARELGLAVTAGNVSTREQASYLRDHGCNTLQGGLWARMDYSDSESAAVSPTTAKHTGSPRRESAESAWKEGYDLLSAIMDNTLDGLAVLESVRNEDGTIRDFRIRKCNQRMGEIVRGTADNLIGKRLLDTYPETKEKGIFQAYCSVVESDIPMQMETRYQYGGLDLSFRITAVRMNDGVLITITDISALKRGQHKPLA
ncbi:EAL domain-containing protein [Marinobacter sp. NP-4(2019)]|uniref:EAL domain-containing protein n=1 Tax=Marinobacter sp. NP-4(2019) TaxID=2488665 RepID=UPI000FC3F07F|nr:EAL domain-containing protein [Marinobacter sp. NP-4(2019)]AZT83896.1 EAL domain-containing protein [Marinobacter sp. NP-4(2019)]